MILTVFSNLSDSMIQQLSSSCSSPVHTEPPMTRTQHMWVQTHIQMQIHPNPLSSGRASPRTCPGLLPGSEQMMRRSDIQVPGTDPPCSPAPASPHLICARTTLSLARTEILECPRHSFMGEALLTSTSQLSFHRLDLLERKRKRKKKSHHDAMMQRLFYLTGRLNEAS